MSRDFLFITKILLFETWALCHNDDLNYFLLLIRPSILIHQVLVKPDDTETKLVTGVFSLFGGFSLLWFG